MKLQGKVAVVTGASRGIGRAIAVELADQGATIIVNYAGNQDAANETVKLITAKGGVADLYQADVSNGDDINKMFKEILARYGKVDILVNNAGITRDNLLMRMKEDDWDKVISTNLKGVYNCTKAVCRSMMKQKSGKIINIASVVGQTGNAGQSNYAAAKAGVIGFTKSMAKELASRGINVNAIAPGYIKTDMTAALSSETKDEFIKVIPLGREGFPSDVAKAVLFLASDDSNYITGQVLNVDGGMIM